MKNFKKQLQIWRMFLTLVLNASKCLIRSIFILNKNRIFRLLNIKKNPLKYRGNTSRHKSMTIKNHFSTFQNHFQEQSESISLYLSSLQIHLNSDVSFNYLPNEGSLGRHVQFAFDQFKTVVQQHRVPRNGGQSLKGYYFWIKIPSLSDEYV